MSEVWKYGGLGYQELWKNRQNKEGKTTEWYAILTYSDDINKEI